MIEQLTVVLFESMQHAVCDAIIKNEQYLCKLDSYVGDGDHGVTVARGFLSVQTMMNEQSFATVEDLLNQTADCLSESMGGAIGPIFGSIFSGMAEASAGKQRIGTTDFFAMLQAGLEEAMMVGGAKEGDRTLIDALAPAVKQLEIEAANQNTLSLALQSATNAADCGVEQTKQMVAKKGRAKFLGEKSKGYQDAGATSISIVIHAMADYVTTATE